MTHRGQRSLTAKVRSYIYRVSHRDTTLCETICTMDKPQILVWVVSNVEFSQGVTISDIPPIEKGLVLTDSRGRGAFQG